MMVMINLSLTLHSRTLYFKLNQLSITDMLC